MAYRFKSSESVEEGVQRAAREQIDKAVAEIDDPELDRHEAVHQVRKRCKKIRGLIRLVRPQFESTYDRENAWYRDAARRLSYVRDAHSIIETLHQLMDHFDEQIDPDGFAVIDQRLATRRDEVAQDEVGLQERLAEFRRRMVEGRERVAAWRVSDKGFDAVEGGLLKTYGRGCAAMAEAFAHPSAESFHEWRKRAKYHWYHLRLVRPIWEDPMKARRDEADLLADLLGDDHDLSVLRATLLEQPEDFGGEDTLPAVMGLIAQYQAELRQRAELLGLRLFAEKPKRLASRFRAYWAAWEKAGEEAPAETYAPRLVTP